MCFALQPSSTHRPELPAAGAAPASAANGAKHYQRFREVFTSQALQQRCRYRARDLLLWPGSHSTAKGAGCVLTLPVQTVLPKISLSRAAREFAGLETPLQAPQSESLVSSQTRRCLFGAGGPVFPCALITTVATARSDPACSTCLGSGFILFGENVCIAKALVAPEVQPRSRGLGRAESFNRRSVA